MNTAIVWFRRDLRLHDNPALARAAAVADRVVPVYVHAPDEDAPFPPGAASRAWLHCSLGSLGDALARRGSPLVLRSGGSAAELRRLARETGADAVFWNRLYEPSAQARDAEVAAALAQDGIAAQSCAGALMAEPGAVKTGGGEPYKVFTPFWNALRVRLPLPAPRPAPAALQGVPRVASLALDALGLRPRPRWDEGIRSAWTPGEDGALALLRRFSRMALAGYPEGRDVPGEQGTSRLSPHLHFGEITPSQIAARLERAVAEDPVRRAGSDALLRELGWRDFAHHLLHAFPATARQPLNRGFQDFAWRRPADYAADLAAWQRGATGIPIVDAGMRELWTTGWMHNRVRMIAASLLTKNLLVPWQEGAAWFWDTLVDADLANNSLGWQWVAGCGADAAPYFRVFNPVLQSRRFDPSGVYLKAWVPELRGLSGAQIHSPWETGGVAGYPAPIVDLGASRLRALEAYRRSRGKADPGPLR